jgi:tRNA-dihydrouridine synthase
MDIWNRLDSPIFVLAPMDDVTDTVFRQVISTTAAPNLYFTEFVNVDGLQSSGREKLLPKLQFTTKEQPIIAQIWGKKPDNYYRTVKDLIEMGFDGVDINMGCPVKAVIKDGCCAALIDNQELAEQIITSVKRAVGESGRDDFPVSVKTRLGNKTLDMGWIEFLLAQKLNALTIHGRLAKDMSKHPADWDKIGEVREMRDRLSPTTKIIGNGDVLSRQQGEELAGKYQLDGIMIGRGIFQDPYVFATQSSWPEKSKSEKLALYKQHVELFAATWQNHERKIYSLNKFCKIYVNEFAGAKELRDQLMHAGSTTELLRLLDMNM